MTAEELHIDPGTPGLFERPDYYDLLARLRAEDPVHRYAPNSWMLARYAEVREVSRDPERFCSGRGVLMRDPLREGGKIEGSILHMDPPAHAVWRKLVSRRFTPRAVAALEGRIRAIARDVLDGVPRATVDFVEAISAPFPVLVIAELLGVDDGDRADFRRWSDATIASPDYPGADLADVAELYRFLVDHVQDRREHPRDDIVSALVGAEVEGSPMSTAAAVGYCLSLLVAGNETTRHLVSGAVLALDEHPDQRSLLACERALMPGAVEEALRWVTPIQAFGRTATCDTELAGVPIARGDFVVMLYSSANRDEAAFGPSADRFEVTRPLDTAHLAFGFGEHLCLGAALARLEAGVMLEELLDRHPDYTVVGPPTWTRSTLVRGMSSLPVQLS